MQICTIDQQQSVLTMLTFEAIEEAIIASLVSPATVALQLALHKVTTSSSFWHHLLYEDAWMNFAVLLSGVTRALVSPFGL